MQLLLQGTFKYGGAVVTAWQGGMGTVGCNCCCKALACTEGTEGHLSKHIRVGWVQQVAIVVATTAHASTDGHSSQHGKVGWDRCSRLHLLLQGICMPG